MSITPWNILRQRILNRSIRRNARLAGNSLLSVFPDKAMMILYVRERQGKSKKWSQDVPQDLELRVHWPVLWDLVWRRRSKRKVRTEKRNRSHFYHRPHHHDLGRHRHLQVREIWQGWKGRQNWVLASEWRNASMTACRPVTYGVNPLFHGLVDICPEVDAVECCRVKVDLTHW